MVYDFYIHYNSERFTSQWFQILEKPNTKTCIVNYLQNKENQGYLQYEKTCNIYIFTFFLTLYHNNFYKIISRETIPLQILLEDFFITKLHNLLVKFALIKYHIDLVPEALILIGQLIETSLRRRGSLKNK